MEIDWEYFKANLSICKMPPRERWRQDMIMEMAREMKVYFNLLHWDFQQRIVEPAKLFAKLKSDIWENERIADLSRTVLPEQLECAWRVSKSGHQKESVEILYGIFERGTFSL